LKESIDAEMIKYDGVLEQTRVDEGLFEFVGDER